jgi:hypothetical protein
MRATRSAALAWGALAFLGLVSSGGCKPSRAVVTGTVRHKGEPLPNGEVHFVGEDGKSRSAVLGPGGAYTIDDSPVGTVKVAVVALKKEGNRIDFAVPKEYRDVNTSKLVYTVRPGSQTIDIDLPE